MRCEGFPFEAGADARVLVLGSMPGIASLRAGQYYAHPRNAFWPIVFSLWDAPLAADYAQRLAFARAHRIALWDAAHTCEREGSLDADMRRAEPNDFDGLMALAPGIRTVLCNGAASHAIVMRSGFPARYGLRVLRMPSTSPAHTMPFEQKRAAWRVLREAAEEGEA